MKWSWRSAVALARWLWRLVTGRRSSAITEPHLQIIPEPAQTIALEPVNPDIKPSIPVSPGVGDPHDAWIPPSESRDHAGMTSGGRAPVPEATSPGVSAGAEEERGAATQNIAPTVVEPTPVEPSLPMVDSVAVEVLRVVGKRIAATTFDLPTETGAVTSDPADVVTVETTVAEVLQPEQEPMPVAEVSHLAVAEVIELRVEREASQSTDLDLAPLQEVAAAIRRVFEEQQAKAESGALEEAEALAEADAIAVAAEGNAEAEARAEPAPGVVETREPSVVIPAKAGIQANGAQDPGFRRSLPSGQLRDDNEVASGVVETCEPRVVIESESKPETTAPAEAKPRPQIEIPKDYVPSVESTHALYQISFDAFAGPLDLLLFLIRRHHLDIFDIPIAFICKEYLACLQAMEDLNVDVAAEFMLTASELLHIKSRMLLPQPAEVEDDEELDPRAELVRRLLEYQKYRVAAEHMAELTRLNRDVFEHPADAIPPIEGQTPLKEVGVFALIEAFGQVLKRQKPEFMHRVALETVSVRRQMTDFVEQLHRQGSICFQDAIAKLQTRLQIVATFLAMLELTKLRLVGIYQSDTGMIYLQPRFARTEDAIGRIAGVEEQYL